MTTTHRIHEDLDYVASAVRREDRSGGVPLVYFLWAAIVVFGFALPDVMPRYAGPYWLVMGIGGGLLSMWIAERDGRRHGIRNAELGRRYGFHWLIVGAAYMLVGLPMIAGRVPMASGASYFLLVGGLAYSLAGVHLDRRMLGSGLLMFAAYIVLTIFELRYTWTITGIVIALALVWAGLSTQRQRRLVAVQ